LKALTILERINSNPRYAQYRQNTVTAVAVTGVAWRLVSHALRSEERARETRMTVKDKQWVMSVTQNDKIPCSFPPKCMEQTLPGNNG
jgi:hypothetical protein